MAASDHINPEQHEPKEPRKQTKQWSRARKKPSNREAAIAREKKKKEAAEAAKKASILNSRAKSEQERLQAWGESGQTLDRALQQLPIIRTRNGLSSFAPAPTEENEGTLGVDYKKYLYE